MIDQFLKGKTWLLRSSIKRRKSLATQHNNWIDSNAPPENYNSSEVQLIIGKSEKKHWEEFLIFISLLVDKGMKMKAGQRKGENLVLVGLDSFSLKSETCLGPFWLNLHQQGPWYSSFHQKKQATRGPNWPPLIQKRNVTHAGPNRPFRCLDR